MSAETTVRRLAERAGVTIGGSNSWDIQVRNPAFYGRVLQQGSLGLGESYMDGWWQCEKIDEFTTRALLAGLAKVSWRDPMILARAALSRVRNDQSSPRAFEVGKKHYDVGNELYRAMLGPSMAYSCGYWKRASSLDEAQSDKHDLICRKLDLEPGMRLLDIGCGWGGLIEHAVTNYGVEAVGVTVSEQQAKYAQNRCRDMPVTIILDDYRNLSDGRFDRVASVGMFEHVGVRNYRTFFSVADRMLVPDGLFLLHTIGGSRDGHSTEPWLGRYIFPNSMLPGSGQILAAVPTSFTMLDWHGFGPYYDPTLLSWYRNFKVKWSEIQKRNPQHYNDRFYRMWEYYLLSCAGTFRSEQSRLWQVVFAKGAKARAYTPVR